MTSFFPVRLRQPDRRTCGPSVLVALRMLESPDVRDRVLGGDAEAAQARFAAEAVAAHRATNRAVDPTGRLQLPWSRALGTAPWALARAVRGRPRLVLPGRRRAAYGWLTDSLARGATPVYVGDRWTPRHVVLAVAVDPDGVECFEPAGGERTRFSHDQWVRGDLDGCGGWRVPWVVVSR